MPSHQLCRPRDGPKDPVDLSSSLEVPRLDGPDTDRVAPGTVRGLQR